MGVSVCLSRHQPLNHLRDDQEVFCGSKMWSVARMSFKMAAFRRTAARADVDLTSLMSWVV